MSAPLRCWVWDFLAQQIGSGGEKDESLPHESDTASWG